MKLAPGQQSSALVIHARRVWNPTRIEVERDERYSFTAQGKWLDASIPSGPRGYVTKDAPWPSRAILWMSERARRVPSQNWFALIGAIDRNLSTAFLIGDSLQGWRAPVSGELECFANDLRIAYGNNHGDVTLTVTRIA